MSIQKGSLASFSIAKQKGASFFGTVMLLVVIGMVLLSGLKVAPSYLDNGVIVNAMEGMANNNDLAEMSVAEIRSLLQRSLQTNNINRFDMSSVQAVRADGQDYIDINYESRVPLFYNIEVVVIFENRFERN
ncbi:MAG: hypothetical protein CMP91_06365 [Gammaproteobacteria bacterium]|nr:hypothetical protein [Gammaproteobacteria bacterium]MAY03319.1 hypothetical protein [Gammaproteobacteria bacterium]|tara:strand:+ start:441 stop:836 length:396 start_codon:yes stop_codon:yes gene_type:complete